MYNQTYKHSVANYYFKLVTVSSCNKSSYSLIHIANLKANLNK